MQTAFVTGAPSGIGRHSARAFARHRHAWVLPAPAEAELEELDGQPRAESDVDERGFADVAVRGRNTSPKRRRRQHGDRENAHAHR